MKALARGKLQKVEVYTGIDMPPTESKEKQLAWISRCPKRLKKLNNMSYSLLNIDVPKAKSARFTSSEDK